MDIQKTLFSKDQITRTMYTTNCTVKLFTKIGNQESNTLKFIALA